MTRKSFVCRSEHLFVITLHEPRAVRTFEPYHIAVAIRFEVIERCTVEFGELVQGVDVGAVFSGAQHVGGNFLKVIYDLRIIRPVTRARHEMHFTAVVGDCVQ
jgi:hypothetical protein